MGGKREEREDLISGDLQTLGSPVTFSQAGTQEEAGCTSLFFFPASLLPNWRFSLSFSLQVRALGASEHSPFSLSDAHIHTHKSDAFIRTHPGAPWLLNCHCSEITALRTRQLDLRAGISCKSPPFFYYYFFFY